MWQKDKLTTIPDLHERLNVDPAIPSGYFIHLRSDTIFILFVDIIEDVPIICSSITIDTNFNVSVSENNSKMSAKKYAHMLKVQNRVHQYSEVLNLMAFCKATCDLIENDEHEVMLMCKSAMEKCIDKTADIIRQKALLFIVEQLELLYAPKTSRRFSPSCLIFSYVLHSVSAVAYRELRKHNLIILPSECTLRKVTRFIGNYSTSEYLEVRLKELNLHQRNVILMIDEIYTSKRMEYSSSEGKVFGITTESTPCGTLLCFMISSLTNNYKDVVGIFPINIINSKKIEICCNEILSLLAKVGFNVVVICMDNHPVNRSYMKQILCKGELKPEIQNPVTGKPLFLLFDPVHNFKNIYNNFQSKNVFKYPDFQSSSCIPTNTALFQNINDLYNLESEKPIRMAYKLNSTQQALKRHQLS